MRHPSQEVIFFTNMLKKAYFINEKTINQKKDHKMTTNMLKKANVIHEKTMNERNCIFWTLSFWKDSFYINKNKLKINIRPKYKQIIQKDMKIILESSQSKILCIGFYKLVKIYLINKWLT